MFYRVLASLCVLCFFCSFKLSERILQGKQGDYIVTEQDHNYSLLLLKESSQESLLFEEITIPVHLIKKSSTCWQDWLLKGAPGHSSWVQYEINPSTFELLEAYSFSKKGWLYLDENQHFLAKLLSLSLNPVDAKDRKKIGPAPSTDEPDRRKTWNPPVFVEGKKLALPCEAWKTTWDADASLLSSCHITLYFPPLDVSTFPAWIEANNGHFNYAIKIVDSGKNMKSPLSKRLSHRPPQLLKHVQINKHQVEIPIKISPYYKTFSLFVFDLAFPSQRIGPIAFTMKPGKEKEDRLLAISLESLFPFLEKNHHYKWVLASDGKDPFAVESEDFFRWAGPL